MKVAIAQTSPVVGDFAGNLQQIEKAYLKAIESGADLLLTPELGVCGYPPHDLLERPEFMERSAQAMVRLLALSRGRSCALVAGLVVRSLEPRGREVQNAACVFWDGKEVFRQVKALLPTYDVYDEARYFEPASVDPTAPAKDNELWIHPSTGVKVGIAICEDLWAEDSGRFNRQKPLYPFDPVERLVKLKPDLLLSLSASPYEFNKRERRERVHAEVARRVGAPLVYANQVGANDELLFDGASFVLDAEGQPRDRLNVFAEDFGVFDLKETTVGGRAGPVPTEMDALRMGLVRGIRDYFLRTGFSKAILGLSGGIDSAVVAALAVEALGPSKVLGVAMPSQFSSSGSLADAEALAQKLGIPFVVRPIKFLFSTALREISGGAFALEGVPSENLQSRLRGGILMTLSNALGALVLTTGNKSEIAMGYATLYGDMCGALAPIGDLFKTRVYELARHINSRSSVIPESSLTKAPSAELRPHQTDQDTLPPYDLLDQLLEGYLEQGRPVEELEAQLGGRHLKGWVCSTLDAVEKQEFKRRQAAPVLKVSPKAFGMGRRMPVAKRWQLK
ncbi:MAG: NAD+ synthase [Oligoflexia bacterium]